MSALPFALSRITTCCCCCLIIIVACCCSCLTALADDRATARVKDYYRYASATAPVTRPVASNGDEAPRYERSAETDAYDELPDDEDEDDYVELNVTAEKSKYLGSPCDFSCNPSLQHVFCDPESKHCECERLYPVQLGPTKGCAKPKKLGEQCLYRATCIYTDQHSTCTQVQHNAVCECESGYHRVGLSRSNKKLFCAADLVLITTDLPTLLGVASGIAVLTGLICFVLKLFSRARYTRPRHYANAGHAPPMLFSSDTGIPLTLHGGRPSSRSSQRSSGGTISMPGGRKQSCSEPGSNNRGAGDRGPLVPASRAGSRRPSLASIHSSTSSAKSYSARRLERERNEKEQRQAFAELKLKREHQQQQQQQQQQQVAPTPSPRTPHSTDELLPSVEEATEIFYNEQIPTTSGTTRNGTKSKTTTTTIAVAAAGAAASSNSSEPMPTTPLFESDAAKPCTSADIYSS